MILCSRVPYPFNSNCKRVNIFVFPHYYIAWIWYLSSSSLWISIYRTATRYFLIHILLCYVNTCALFTYIQIQCNISSSYTTYTNIILSLNTQSIHIVWVCPHSIPPSTRLSIAWESRRDAAKCERIFLWGCSWEWGQEVNGEAKKRYKLEGKLFYLIK